MSSCQDLDDIKCVGRDGTSRDELLEHYRVENGDL